MPVEAASLMMATSLSPSMNMRFSAMLTIFWASCSQRCLYLQAARREGPTSEPR
jgi:hypothetical protein